MIEIRLNRGTCQGYGNCVLVAGALFTLGDDGIAELSSAVVGDEHLDAARKAAYDCPTESISLVDQSDERPTEP